MITGDSILSTELAPGGDLAFGEPASGTGGGVGSHRGTGGSSPKAPGGVRKGLVSWQSGQ